MKPKFNIVIPAISLNSELLLCLKKLNKQNYNNFFVTLILDFNTKKKIEKLKYKLRIIVTGKKNMSYKRNLAVRKYDSRYIAFLDSDAYPHNNWLKIGEKYLKVEKGHIIGGPSIPFPNKNFFQNITYLSKRSYFVTGYQSFRKYKSSRRYCDWLESCNLLMKRDFFLKHKMNENIYTGEDKELFERIRKTKKDLKVFHCPKLFIFHNERNYSGFLLQRMSFGMDFLNLINSKVGLKGFQASLPLVISLIYLLYFLFAYLNPNYSDNIIYFLSFFVFFSLAVIIEISFYIKEKKFIIPVFLTIILANIFFGLGSILSLFGFRKNLLQSIYRKSQNEIKREFK